MGRGRTGASPTGDRRPLLCFLGGGERAGDEVIEGLKYAEPVVAHAGAGEGGRSAVATATTGARAGDIPAERLRRRAGARETPAAGRRLPYGGPGSPARGNRRRRVTRGRLKSQVEKIPFSSF